MATCSPVWWPAVTSTGTLRASLRRPCGRRLRRLRRLRALPRPPSWPRGAARRRPSGREHYALASRYFLGATVDLDETYAWGWEELKRLHDDMTATADRIVPGGSIDEAVAALDADPARQIEGKEAFRGWMQELADRTIAELAGVHFDIPRADPADRVLPGPDQRRWHLLHRPVRGLLPAGPDVVVGAGRHQPLLARGAR